MRGVCGAVLSSLVSVIAACNEHGSMPHGMLDDARPDAPATLMLAPMSMSFGSVGVGEHSAPASLTATNIGTSSTSIVRTSIASPDMQFAIANDGCSGGTLSPGATCTFQVLFMPLRVGGSMATVAVTDGLASATAQTDGSGINSDNVNFVNPGSIDFGDVPLGTTGTSSTKFTVSNVGGSTHGPISITLAGPDPTAFTIVSDTCSGIALPAGGFCTFGATFTPHSSGIAMAFVQVSSNPPGGTTTAVVRGTGLDPTLRIDLTSRAFGTVPELSASEYARFVVTNVSTSATAALTTAITGTNPGDFTIAAATNTCAGAALAPGATCIVDVRFEPGSNLDNSGTPSSSSRRAPLPRSPT